MVERMLADLPPSERGPAAGEIARRVEARLRETLGARYAAIAGGVRDAGRIGTGAARDTLAAAFGSDAPPATFPTDRESVARAGRLLRSGFSVDGPSLSARLVTHDRASARVVARVLERELRAGADARAIATSLRRSTDVVPMARPAYLDELLAARRLGGDDLRAAIDRHVRTVEALKPGELGLRGAARRLLRDVERGTDADVRRTVTEFMERRAYLSELRLARTEVARSFATAYRADTESAPWTVGYRWTLSGTHPRPDICDLYAGQDTAGLGSGVYTSESVPMVPAHPNCLCHLEQVIDLDHFERTRAREAGEPEPPRPWATDRRETGVEWLQRQPAERRAAILGSGRAALFERAPHAVVTSDTRFRSLREAARAPRRAPARTTPGPVDVPARRATRRDGT